MDEPLLFRQISSNHNEEKRESKQPLIQKDNNIEMIFQSGKIGITFEGNKIRNVVPNSQAADAGVCIGWTILQVNGNDQPDDQKQISKAIHEINALEKPIHIIFAKDNLWECPRCTFSNALIDDPCEICGHPNPHNIRSEEWSCSLCTFVQTNQNNRCEMCNTPHDKLRESFIIEEIDNVHFDQRSFFQQMTKSIKKKAPRREPDFYCAICMENIAISKKANLCCPHEYCRNCMEQHVSLEIREARVLNITCPGNYEKTGRSCTAPFSKKDIQEIVDKETWERYERFVKKKTNKHFVECPFCNQMQKGYQYKPKMICEREECKKEFCFIHSNAHVGTSCAQYKKKHRKELRENMKFKQETSIKCPIIYCGIPIHKIDGCNHMTCNECHAEFCYLCGDDFMGGIHFHPYNFLGCPDMQMRNELRPNSRRNPFRTCLARLILWPFVILMFIMGCLWCETCFLVGWAICCPFICMLSCYKLYADPGRWSEQLQCLCAGCFVPYYIFTAARISPTTLCRRDMIYPCLAISIITALAITSFRYIF